MLAGMWYFWKRMRITLEDGHFSYQADWAKGPQIEEGHLPSIDDCIESFLQLLENIYSKEKIADCLAEGLNAMEYSKKERLALKKMRKQESIWNYCGESINLRLRRFNNPQTYDEYTD